MSSIHSICNCVFENLVRLRCGHIHCRSCLGPSTTQTITCEVCNCDSQRVELVRGETMMSEIRELSTTFAQCSLPNPMEELETHIPPSQTIMSGDFPQQMEERIVPTNPIRCPYYGHGCTDLFLSDQLPQHYASEEHRTSAMSHMRSVSLDMECARNELIIIPPDENSPSCSEYTALLNDSQHHGQVTNHLTNPVESSNLRIHSSNVFSNTSLNLIYQRGREQIQNMDRNSDHSSSIQTHQDQLQSSESMTSHISSLMTPSFGNDDANHRTKQGQQDQDPAAADEHNNNQSCSCKHAICSNGNLQTKAEVIPVSAHLDLIWRIYCFSRQLDDAISKKELLIDLLISQIPINGHKLRAYLQLDDKNKPRFISLHVHLNHPAHRLFHGQIKFTLIDQSTNRPLSPIIKLCPEEMNSVNNYFDWDNFISIDELRVQGNRFVFDDSIIVLIQINQKDEKALADLSANVQDALNQIPSMQ